MRRIAADRGLENLLEIDSAGTYGGHAGQLPDARMRAAASRRGYELTHRSRPLREEDFDAFDRIVVMDDANYERVCRMAPERRHIEKVCRMVDFCRHHPQWSHIPDPYYEGREGFELVLDLLEDGCEGLADAVTAEQP